MYLLTIYRLHLDGEDAGCVRLAQRMGVSAGSCTEMVKKLIERGLVERTQGKEFQLTRAGLGMALRVIRKHRLVERLLTDHLKIPWDHAHEQACRLEHVLSDQVADALEEFLGFPETCPHGYPIPDRQGRLAVRENRPLSECRPGERVEVDRVAEDSGELLRYLEEMDLKPGREVFIEQVAPFEGPLLVQVGPRQFPLSRRIAAKIAVRPKVAARSSPAAAASPGRSDV
jgi:DtxR family Mn-dependent transcriptional regulator